MATVKVLLGAALTCIAALAIHTPGLAQHGTGDVQGNACAREIATNGALLEALLKRRAEVAQATGATDNKRRALDFLDSRIAELRSRIGR